MPDIDSGRIIRLSTYAHFFEREDVIAVIHSLTSVPVFISPKLKSVLTQLETGLSYSDATKHSTNYTHEEAVELVNRLAEANMVVPMEYSEQDYLDLIRSKVFRGPRFNILFMLLTEACNLHCPYCFIEGSKPKKYRNCMMTTETARQAVQMFGKHQSRTDGDPKSIVFYGGEPLLNQDALFTALDQIDGLSSAGVLPARVDRILITNGTLLTPTLAKSLAERNVFPYVSIDGPPEIHNRQRPFHNGRGSFDRAVRGLELVRSVGMEPGISVTVTEEMIDDLPQTLEWLITNIGVKSVGFNMLESIPGRDYFSESYGDRFANALLKCQEICDKYEVYEERVMRKVKQFAKQEVYVYDCAACGEQLTIAPDGQIGVCQGFVGTREFYSGFVSDPNYDPNADPVFIDWSNVSPLNNDKCLSCSALGLCGGGCPRNPYILGKGIGGIDTRYCTHTLKTQEWIVFQLYDKIQDDKGGGR